MNGLTGNTGLDIRSWYTLGTPISAEAARNIASAWSRTNDDAFTAFAATGEVTDGLMETIRLAWAAEDDDQTALGLEALAAHVRAIQAPGEPFLAGDDSVRNYLVSLAPVR